MDTDTKTNLTVVIVDDEVRAGDAIRLMLEKFVPRVKKILVCTDARQAAETILQVAPHIVFLDIKMPHLSGFEVLQQIPSPSFKVIFTTAFNEFAITAIRFSAFDYLLKPVDAEELIAAVDRYVSIKAEPIGEGDLLNNMLHNLQASSGNFRLAIPSRDGVHFIPPSTIMYCEAVSNYTRFYTDSGRQFMTSKTLGDYEDLLTPYHFIRCHKSYIVNKNFIDYVDNERVLVLKGAIKLEVSKRRRAEVMRLLKE